MFPRLLPSPSLLSPRVRWETGQVGRILKPQNAPYGISWTASDLREDSHAIFHRLYFTVLQQDLSSTSCFFTVHQFAKLWFFPRPEHQTLVMIRPMESCVDGKRHETALFHSFYPMITSDAVQGYSSFKSNKTTELFLEFHLQCVTAFLLDFLTIYN